MALINGNDYDHIDFTKNGVTTRHMLKDALSRQMSGDLVKVQNEEPTSEGTKIWIKPSGDSEVQVPTYEEFEELSDKIDDADATIESLAVGAQPTVSVIEVDGHKRFSFGIPASNGIASITKTATDGVIDTYTIAMTDGTSTSFSVNNSDITPESMAEAIATALQDYARIDGYYPDLTAGNADQLNSTKFVENKEPYLYRPSGGTSDIGNRKYLDAIVGVSLPWNQMVRDEASENQTDFADILTVTDAVEDAAGVKVQIEPVQDLHGYDHPWPAGGGKNKANLTVFESTIQGGITITNNGDGSITVNGTATANVNLTLMRQIAVENGAWTISGVPSNTAEGTFSIWARNAPNESEYARTYNGRSGTVNITTGTIYIYMTVSNGTTVDNVKCFIQLESGSTATAWSPYANICPITGWTATKVTRTGKNLFDVNALLANRPSYTINFDGSVTILGNDGMAWSNITRTMPIKAGTYTLSRSGNIGLCDIRFGYENYATGHVMSAGDTTKILTIAHDTTIKFKADYSAGSYPVTDHFQLELSSTATDYEPYAGNTYSITLPTEAGTVYGGELTVNANGSGSLVADRATYTITGAENFTLQLTDDNCTNGLFPINNAKKNQGAITNDTFKRNGTSPYNNTGVGVWQGNSNWWYVCLNTSSLSEPTVAGFKAWLNDNNINCLYYLAEPRTYPLTASEVTTLLGTNNIWSDTGDVALTYTGTDEHLTLESGKKYLARINGTDSMLLGSAQEITAAKGTDNAFDLTKMFGTSVADYVYNQGAGFFRQWFGKTWYPYNTGELKHVEGLESHDVVGFNIWDEEWEVGTYNTSDGTPLKREQIRCKNLISIIPNTSYYVHTSLPGADGIWMFFYDADKNLITDQWPTGSSAHSLNAYRFNNSVLTTSSRMYYCKFYVVASYGTTYKHDISISLVHNGSRNGEYESYEKHSYPLDNTVILRGVPKVNSNGVYWDGDRYSSDGTVERRYGVVDLGTLLYTKSASGLFQSESLAGTAKATPNSANISGQIISPLYSEIGSSPITGPSGANPSPDMVMAINTRGTVYFNNLSYTDINTFKAAMSGVMLVYELAEPTYEQATPYRNFQLVDDWGTEEFVTTGMIPVGHESRYPANLRDKLQHLPDAAGSNGSYLITQTDGQMTLTPFPAPPATAGKYALRATVTNGVATFTWEATT